MFIFFWFWNIFDYTIFITWGIICNIYQMKKKSVFLKITGHFLSLNWIFCLFQVNCLADGVLVDIDLRDKNFNGVMYVKGHRNDQVSVILCSFIYHSSPAGPNFNLSCKKDKYILSPAISLEVLTLEKRYYTR